MGGLFSGSSKTSTTSTTNSGPSQFQSPYLTDAFNAAQSNFDSQSALPYYQGETYASLSDSAKQSLQNLQTYASGAGLSTANQLSSLGTSLSGYADKAGSTIDQYLATANQDPTQSNIASASQYADNPYLSAQIDAANRDVSRTLNEQTLPTIDRTAAGTGNINSSRAGVAQGIAERGAADQMADTAATMRGNAYSQGLTLASADRAQQLQALGNAASAYTGLAGTGINALQAGTQAGYGAYNEIANANSALQADQQGKDTAAFNQWQGQDQRQADLLAQYMNIIGGNSWGSSSTSSGTSTQTSTPSLLSAILGAAATGAAFLPKGK